MKKYVLLTFNYSVMGGAQLYVRDKQEYMKSAGWNVYMFGDGYADKPEDVLIDDLKEYYKGLNPCFSYYPHVLQKKDVEKIVTWMLESINYKPGDQVLIESNNTRAACWGELLAQRTNGKNFCYILAENFHGDCLEFMPLCLSLNVHNLFHCGRNL